MSRKGGKSNRASREPARETARRSTPEPTVWRPLWSAGVLALSIALVFGPSIVHPFSMWDDTINVSENPHLNPVRWDSVARFWREPYAFLYVPATYTFWSAEAWLAEAPATPEAPRHLAPWVFHLGNLLLHLAGVLGVWSVLRLVVRAELPALCGALLYAVHPLQVESVAWVTETKGLLAGALGWFAVWQHLLALNSDRQRYLRHGVAALVFALALLAKPSAVALAPMALLVDVVFSRRSIRQSLVSLGPWFVLAGGSVAITWWQQSGESLHYAAPPMWQRPIIAGDALAFYLLKLVAPFQLGIDYGRSPAAIFANGSAYAMWLVPLAVVAAIAWTRERRAWWGALAIFVVGLAPVLGFVPFSFQDFSTVADRYAYLAMFGPALAVAWFLARRPQSIWLFAFAALAICCGALAAWQVSRWRDDRTLFEHAIQVNDRSFLSYNLLGLTLLKERPSDVPGAIGSFHRAIEIAPERARSYCNLGLMYQELKEFDHALEEYRRAAEVEPEFAEAHHGTGLALASAGRHEEAIPAYRRTLELEPGYAIGWYNLALSLVATGDTSGAIDALQRTLNLQPSLEPAHLELVRLLIVAGRTDDLRAEFRRWSAVAPGDAQLHDRFAVALFHLGEYDEALEEVELAIELAPRDLTPRRHRAWILLRQGNVQAAIEQLEWIEERQPGSPAGLDLAWTLSTHPEATWRDGAEAVRLATRYCEHVRYADPRGLDVLAAAYAESGDSAKAIETARRALADARSGGHDELAAAIERRLARYERGEPYRANPEEL